MKTMTVRQPRAKTRVIKEILVAYGRARAQIAVLKAQLRSARAGRDRLSPAAIEREISAARRSR